MLSFMEGEDLGKAIGEDFFWINNKNLKTLMAHIDTVNIFQASRLTS